MKPNILTNTLILLSVATSIGVSATVLTPVQAQNNIILFGSGKDSTLSYKVRNQSPGANLNTFNFFAELPKSKAVAELRVTYPPEFRGAFLADKVKIVDRQTKREYKLNEVIVDRQIGSTRFVFAEPIPAKPSQSIELIVSGITNPRSAQMYRIEAQALGTEANPLFQYLGHWLVSIY